MRGPAEIPGLQSGTEPSGGDQSPENLKSRGGVGEGFEGDAASLFLRLVIAKYLVEPHHYVLHIRPAALAGPVTWEALESFVGDVAGNLLSRDLPLWEMWVVEGLDRDRVALVTKLHHCMMDGGAGGDLMASMFDLTPDAEPPPPPETPWVPDRIPLPSELVARSARSFLRRQLSAPREMTRAMGNVAGAVKTWVASRAAGSASAIIAPRTVVNGATTPRRSTSLTMVDLDTVKAIRKAFDTTVNDVVMAASATALRGYLSTRGGIPDRPLVAAVPVNVRIEAPGTEQFGNKVSNMLVGLPLQPDDPVERLKTVHESAASSKAVQSALGPKTLQLLTGIMAPPVMTAMVRAYSSLNLANHMRPMMNLIVSNVPGPPVDLYCAGAKVTGIFPMGPLLPGSGVNVTVLSEAHHLNVGIMACPDLVDDVAELGRKFVAAVEELHALAGKQG